MPVREEGRTTGYEEGLYMGRQMGYNEGHHDGNENALELGESTSDEEYNDARSHVQLRSGASTRRLSKRSGSARSVRTFETSLHPLPPPAPLRVVPARVRMPFYSYRTPSPPSDLDELETIHPIPISPSTPIISNRPFRVPIDNGWIPTADSRTSYIQVPPPHELRQPVSPSPSSVTTEAPESRATQQSPPTPVSSPIRSRDYDHQASVPPPISSRTSTHISQYGLANKRLGSSSRNEIYVGRARSGSQPSREDTSRNEHRDQEHRHSNRTEADSITKQWRANGDASPPRTPPRLLTPFAVPHPHQPPGFHYQARKLVAPPPLGDVEDPQLRRRVPTESAAVRSHPLPDDPASQPTRTRSDIVTPPPVGHVNDPQHRRLVPTESTVAHSRPLPDRPVSFPTHTGFLLEHHQHSRQPRRGSGSSSSSILNTVVEPPFEPETTMSPRPSVTIADISSPEAANQPLPQENVNVHQHQHRPSYSHSQSQAQPSSRRHHHPSSSYDAPQRSGTTFTPRPVGFIPSSPGHSIASSSSIPGPGPERDHRHAHSHPTPASPPNRSATPPNDYVPTHMQSASMSTGHGAVDGTYGAAPSVRPHTSHHRHRELDRDRDSDRVREKIRDTSRDWDWDGDREWRRDSGRDSERERHRDRDRDPDTDLDNALSRSPAPLQRPVSLFDSDEEQ
ncbi:hypothetical protein OG21DRAFT_904309 [Imleria badia]|nr:hypothetical protein OG21DRAFT_904309 [Imleria badia]